MAGLSSGHKLASAGTQGLAGASAGTMVGGPIGTLVGGGIGALSGLMTPEQMQQSMYNPAAQQAQEQQLNMQMMQQAPLSNNLLNQGYNYMPDMKNIGHQ